MMDSALNTRFDTERKTYDGFSIKYLVLTLAIYVHFCRNMWKENTKIPRYSRNMWKENTKIPRYSRNMWKENTKIPR
jgi:hypothetical protein